MLSCRWLADSRADAEVAEPAVPGPHESSGIMPAFLRPGQTPAIREQVMAAVDGIVLAGMAGFAIIIIIATVLVIIGVHQEERRSTLTDRPPTIPALLARRILGGYLQPPPRPKHERDSI
jgi:hypothetical protein